MTLGEIIKKYREEQGMSQRRFAELSGLSNSYIWMLERNMNTKNDQPIKPSLESIKAIATVMGLQTDDILRQLGDTLVDISGTGPVTDPLNETIISLVNQLPEEQKLSLLDLLQLAVAGLKKQ